MSSADVSARGRALVVEVLRARGYTMRDEKEGRRPVLRAVSRSGILVVRVSTRQRGDWQTSIAYGDHDAQIDAHRLWAFVDLAQTPPDVRFATEAAVARDIWENHEAYLRKHSGRRAFTQDSKHHRITTERVDRLSRVNPLPLP